MQIDGKHAWSARMSNWVVFIKLFFSDKHIEYYAIVIRFSNVESKRPTNKYQALQKLFLVRRITYGIWWCLFLHRSMVSADFCFSPTISFNRY